MWTKLAAADGDGALDVFFFKQEVLLRPLRKRHDLLRAALQQHSVLGQDYIVAAAREELHAKLRLQIGDLPRQRRLRHMQLLRRAGEVLLPRNGQEISQYTKLHTCYHLR